MFPMFTMWKRKNCNTTSLMGDVGMIRRKGRTRFFHTGICHKFSHVWYIGRGSIPLHGTNLTKTCVLCTKLFTWWMVAGCSRPPIPHRQFSITWWWLQGVYWLRCLTFHSEGYDLQCVCKDLWRPKWVVQVWFKCWWSVWLCCWEWVTLRFTGLWVFNCVTLLN